MSNNMSNKTQKNTQIDISKMEVKEIIELQKQIKQREKEIEQAKTQEKEYLVDQIHGLFQNSSFHSQITQTVEKIIKTILFNQVDTSNQIITDSLVEAAKEIQGKVKVDFPKGEETWTLNIKPKVRKPGAGRKTKN